MKPILNDFRSALCLLLALFFLLPLVATAANTKKKETDIMKRDNWIWSEHREKKNSTSYFRREYSLKGTPASLTLTLSAHNHLKFYVNGTRITGEVSPAPAVLPECIYYLSYHFEGEELKALLGENQGTLCLASAVQFLGDSGANYINGHPAFWCEGEVLYEDGSRSTLKTDNDWLALSETPYRNETPSSNGRRNNAQIDYDARKMPDALAWTQPGFDVTRYGAWTNAVSAHRESAEWKMRLQPTPEGSVHEGITPTPFGKQEIGHQVFDVGRIVSGWVESRLSAPAGTRIRFRYSEYMEGDVVSTCVGSKNQKSENYCDYYTFSGNGAEHFAFDFDYKAFQYFEIVGMDRWVSPEEITVQWASTDIHEISSFSSSDEFLTKLFRASCNTQINNVLGMPVDCPHREQAQYLADSQLQFALLSYAFEEYPEICYKTLLDFACSQEENGRFSFTAPTTAYANKLSIPEWDLRYSDILYRYLQHGGDLKDADLFYRAASRNVRFYWNMRNAKGLLQDEPGAWNISDHPKTKHVPDDPGSDTCPTVVNLLLFDSLNKLSKIADLLGKQAEAEEWEKLAADCRKAINENLLNPDNHLYVMHSGVRLTNLGVTAMAINTGVAKPEDLEKQLRALSSLQNIDTSVVLTFELLRTLLEHGNTRQKEAAYRRIVTSWGPMMENGYETVWEGFLNQSSHSHAWSGYPAYYLLKDFLGVEFEGIGRERVSVIPFLPQRIESMRGSVALPNGIGSLGVALERKDGLKLTLDVPALDDLTVAVPRFEDLTLVSVNGISVFDGETGQNAIGVQYLSCDSEYVYFSVTQSNRYVFLATQSTAPSPDGSAIGASSEAAEENDSLSGKALLFGGIATAAAGVLGTALLLLRRRKKTSHQA